MSLCEKSVGMCENQKFCANVMGKCELFKTITGISKSINQIYLLDLETLEGDWLSFQPTH